jgi:hypothetical protein
MSDTDSITPNARRFSIGLPRPLWIGVTAFLLVVVAIGLHVGVPIDRQHAAIREIERVRDPKLPMDERKAIGITMTHFADENGGHPIDAEFSATREPDGYRVTVWFVTGRDFLGRPSFTPGGHCTVNISKEGKVLVVLGGK